MSISIEFAFEPLLELGIELGLELSESLELECCNILHYTQSYIILIPYYTSLVIMMI
jgi:hypothetical protein